MRRTARMNVDRRAELGEPPGGPGVIEMNVTQENVANVARFGAELAQFVSDRFKSRFRSGIEKGQALAGFEGRHRDDAAAAEMLRIQDVNHSPPRGVKLGFGFFGATPRAVRGSY